LIPFVKSLHSSSPASAPPAPSVTSRKFSLQSTTTSNGGGYGGHSRKGSEGLISYPIVSLRDTLPTFTPDEERRPAPIPTTTINDQRSAPPPPPLPQSRTTTVDEDRTPTPQQRRPSRTTRSPPPPLDLEFAGSNYSVFPVRQSATKIRRGSNATMTERMEKVPSNSSSSSGRIRGLRISHVGYLPTNERNFSQKLTLRSFCICRALPELLPLNSIPRKKTIHHESAIVEEVLTRSHKLLHTGDTGGQLRKNHLESFKP
jgi:hypothetical protein